MKVGVVNKPTTVNRFFLHTLQRTITQLAVITRKTNIKLGILKRWKRATRAMLRCKLRKTILFTIITCSSCQFSFHYDKRYNDFFKTEIQMRGAGEGRGCGLEPKRLSCSISFHEDSLFLPHVNLHKKKTVIFFFLCFVTMLK